MGFIIAFIIIVLIVLYSLARTAGESDRILENIREQSLLGRRIALVGTVEKRNKHKKRRFVEKVTDYGVRPLVSHVTSEPGDVSAYFLDEYTGQLEAQNEITSQDLEFSIEYCTDLCDSVWGDLWN